MIRLLPRTSAFCSLCWKEENGQLLRDKNSGTSRTVWEARTGFLLQWHHNTTSSVLWPRAHPDISSQPYLNPASYTSCCQAPLLVRTPHRYCKLLLSHVNTPPPPPKKSNSVYSFLKATYSHVFVCFGLVFFEAPGTWWLQSNEGLNVTKQCDKDLNPSVFKFAPSIAVWVRGAGKHATSSYFLIIFRFSLLHG